MKLICNIKKTTIIIILIIINIFSNINGCNCSLISKEGDYIFGFLSDLVYNPKDKQQKQKFQFLSMAGECMEWSILLDHSRLMVFQSILSNNLIVSFKGTSHLTDIITDINCIPVSCNITSIKGIDCGKVHSGFQEEYYQIYDLLLSTIKLLNQSYDIYFTGHSLGGAIALLASLDYSINHKLDQKYIKSINLITFGQPGVGDKNFIKFVNQHSTKFLYRRYVNINNQTTSFGPEQDPITNSLFSHPNTPILLDCKKSECPIFQLGLHFLDLYMGNIFNQHYSECNPNCNFNQENAKFRKFRQHYCPIGTESIIKGIFKPNGRFPDKYSVCLFTSKEDFSKYSYKSSIGCENNSVAKVLVEKTTNKVEFEKRTTGQDLFVIVENRNSLLSTSSFSYNLTFTNSIQAPPKPSNLSCHLKEVINDNIDILVLFNSQITSDYHIYQNITYNVYISEIGKDWKKIPFVEKSNLSHISKLLNIPKGIYSIVVTAEISNLESQPSNFGFIFGNTTLI